VLSTPACVFSNIKLKEKLHFIHSTIHTFFFFLASSIKKVTIDSQEYQTLETMTTFSIFFDRNPITCVTNEFLRDKRPEMLRKSNHMRHKCSLTIWGWLCQPPKGFDLPHLMTIWGDSPPPSQPNEGGPISHSVVRHPKSAKWE
jgi:hypothetical protein